MDTTKLPSLFTDHLGRLEQGHFAGFSGPVDSDLFASIKDSWRIVLIDNRLKDDLNNVPSGVEIDFKKNCLNIKIEKNKKIEKPLVLYLITSKQAIGHLTKIKLKVTVGTCGFLSILEKHLHWGNDKDDYGLMSENHLLVEKNAELQFVRCWQGGDGTLFLTDLVAELQRDARFHSFTLTGGGKLSRHQIAVSMPDRGACAQVHGLYNLHKKQHADHFSTIDHLTSHTQSDQLFKGILQDESRGMFKGDIRIHPQANAVCANQLNKNLLLGKKVHALARPELNIAMDDVQCTHGVTVGQLMEEEDFYLQSRGINKERTREILLHAFSRDVLLKIPQDDIRDHLAQSLENLCSM